MKKAKNFKNSWITLGIGLVLALFIGSASAQEVEPAVAITPKPPLRSEVSLNGTWTFAPLEPAAAATTIPVPEYWDMVSGFENVKRARYSRTVNVPASWAGKRIKVEFEGVNHIADVYVNNVLVNSQSHVGGWIPFSYDITSKVTPGSSFTLRVDVKNANFSPITTVDGPNGHHIWPIHGEGALGKWGMIFDVWLRAYGTVHIEDAFIKTSHRNNTITVDYTLKNAGTTSRTVTINADASRGTVEKSFTSNSVILAPGEKKVVKVTSSWTNPARWLPTSPNLYVLTSKVMQGTTELDQESRRFGFREIWVQGNQFMLNGVRVNLLGTSITYHSAFYKTGWSSFMSPTTWSSTIDKLFKNHIRVIRFHQEPVASHILDTADEKGLLVISESAFHGGRSTYGSNGGVPNVTLLNNVQTWIGPWIAGNRNHPSIIMWSAENEICWMDNYPKNRSADLKVLLGDKIRQFDVTRPVTYDGDYNPRTGVDVGDVVANWHYPEGYGQVPTGNMYNWETANQHLPVVALPNRPTGIGEFITSYDTNVPPDLNKVAALRWWQGTWCRGMRYSNFTDIRPFRLDWVIENEPGFSNQNTNQRNSFAPVALFDKAYDGLGINPLTTASLRPSLAKGATVNRTLILYNDEYSGTNVTVDVKVKSGSTTYASGAKQFTLALGNHVDIPYSFRVPFTAGSPLYVVLTTMKSGVVKFREIKCFNLSGSGTGTTSNQVTITGGTATTGDTSTYPLVCGGSVIP